MNSSNLADQLDLLSVARRNHVRSTARTLAFTLATFFAGWLIGLLLGVSLGFAAARMLFPQRLEPVDPGIAIKLFLAGGRTPGGPALTSKNGEEVDDGR